LDETLFGQREAVRRGGAKLRAVLSKSAELAVDGGANDVHMIDAGAAAAVAM
jgi:hypothetical protein